MATFRLHSSFLGILYSRVIINYAITAEVRTKSPKTKLHNSVLLLSDVITPVGVTLDRLTGLNVNTMLEQDS